MSHQLVPYWGFPINHLHVLVELLTNNVHERKGFASFLCVILFTGLNKVTLFPPHRQGNLTTPYPTDRLPHRQGNLTTPCPTDRVTLPPLTPQTGYPTDRVTLPHRQSKLTTPYPTYRVALPPLVPQTG